MKSIKHFMKETENRLGGGGKQNIGPSQLYLSPHAYCKESHFLNAQEGTCFDCLFLLEIIVKFVFFGSMLHALERHFLTALPFLLQKPLMSFSSDKQYIIS